MVDAFAGGYAHGPPAGGPKRDVSASLELSTYLEERWLGRKSYGCGFAFRQTQQCRRRRPIAR